MSYLDEFRARQEEALRSFRREIQEELDRKKEAVTAELREEIRLAVSRMEEEHLRLIGEREERYRSQAQRARETIQSPELLERHLNNLSRLEQREEEAMKNLLETGRRRLLDMLR